MTLKVTVCAGVEHLLKKIILLKNNFALGFDFNTSTGAILMYKISCQHNRDFDFSLPTLTRNEKNLCSQDLCSIYFSAVCHRDKKTGRLVAMKLLCGCKWKI